MLLLYALEMWLVESGKLFILVKSRYTETFSELLQIKDKEDDHALSISLLVQARDDLDANQLLLKLTLTLPSDSCPLLVTQSLASRFTTL